MALPITMLVKHVGTVILRVTREVRPCKGFTRAKDFSKGSATATSHPVLALIVVVRKQVLHVECIAKE